MQLGRHSFQREEGGQVSVYALLSYVFGVAIGRLHRRRYAYIATMTADKVNKPHE